MSASVLRVEVEEGARAKIGLTGGFEVAELCFAPRFRHGAFEPETPYVGVVLGGALEKRFAGSSWELGRGDSFTMPAGARHAARFGAAGARVVVVRVGPGAADDVGGLLRRLRRGRRLRAASLAGQIAAELSSGERAWPLAVEGLALELLADLDRGAARPGGGRPPPAWLAEATELLEQGAGPTSLRELAAVVGVHPSHLARVFKARHGLSVGDYARARRLDWAAARLAEADAPVAVIAREAGFCDQSHFTRAFARHTGLTPARYRLRATSRP